MNSEQTGTQKQIFEKEKNRREKLATYFYDLSKLVFAGTFLTNIPGLLMLDFTISNVVNIIFGFILMSLLAWNANRLLTY